MNLDSIAERTKGYTGADLEDVVRRAGLNALRARMDAPEVTMEFFEAALEESRASVTPEMERDYQELAATLKRESPRGTHRVGFLADRY